MTLRETGSAFVPAPREQVLLALQRRLESRPGVRALGPDRVETPEGTYVLRETPGGTRLVHARVAPGLPLPRPREELRQAVEAELDLVRRLAEGGSFLKP